MTNRRNSSTLTKVFRRLAQPDVPFYILPALMVLLAAGTVAQRWMDSFAAQKLFFSALVVWAGPLPLPGGMFLCGALALCLCAKFVLYSPWNRARAGINLVHLGVLILLAGGLLTVLTAREGSLTIAEGGSAQTVQGDIRGNAWKLPFSLELTDFRRSFWPGTDRPRAYESHIIVHDGAVSWPSVIAMNEPLRYRGYTFFQSSFDENGPAETTILTVVKNRGWLFPYAGSALMAAGLLWHLLVRTGHRNRVT